MTQLMIRPIWFAAASVLLMFGCAGEALSRDITIDPVEIESAMWVTRDEMMTVFAGEHPVMKPARKGAIAQFLLKNWLADTLD